MTDTQILLTQRDVAPEERGRYNTRLVDVKAADTLGRWASRP